MMKNGEIQIIKIKMKRTVTYFFSIFFLLQVSLQSYSSNPKDFVYELVNDAINHLSNKDLSKDELITNEDVE